MKKNPIKRALAAVLTLLLVCTTVLSVPTNVDAATKATKITLSAKSQTVYVGKSFTLKVKKVTPSKASKAVKFSTSDSSVATVSSKGKVTGKKPGKATITVVSTTNAKAKATCKVTVKQQVKKIQTASSIVLQKGKSATIKYGVTPNSAASKKMTFTTSNKKVATVDKKGKITGKKVGTAKITVKSADGCAKATVKVSVKSKVTAVTSVKLDKTSLELAPGAAETLKATVAPSKATSKTVYWVSSNTDVVTVSTKGAVKAVKDGTAKITAYATDASGKKATCTVTVKTPEPAPTPDPGPTPNPDPTPNPGPSTVEVTGISVAPTAVTLKVGETAKATATVAPENATDKTITWTTSDDKIATVKDGEITAVAAGKATVTASSKNGKTATVAVTVEEKTPDVVEVESVTITPSEVEPLKIGGTVTVAATVAPENATDKTITWTTSDDKIATVEAGKITAVAAGTATITASSNNGKTATISVTVIEEEKPIIDSKDGITTISLDSTKNYEVTFENVDGRKEERIVIAKQMSDAYAKYQELAAATTVQEVWDKITTEAVKPYADIAGATVTITTNGNTKTVTSAYKNYTATSVATLDGSTITVTTTSDKLVGGSKTAVISNINMTDKTAVVKAGGRNLDISWNAKGVTISKADSAIAVEYKDGKYVATIDEVLAAELYDAAKKATTATNIPASFEDALKGLTINKAELAYFDFDTAATDGAYVGENAIATISGGSGATINTTDKVKGTGALSLGDSTYLDVKNADESPVISGQDEITISYYSKSTSSEWGTGWACFVALDDKVPTYGERGESYLGIMDKTNGITIERFANGRVNESIAGEGTDAWKRIDVVYGTNYTTLYVNGVEVSTKPAKTSIEDSIGTNSIFYIGKATWGSGEYYTGLVDDFTVYAGALTADQISCLYTENASK